MTTVISPALTPSAAPRLPAGGARTNDSPEGKRFDMALEQSRAANAARTEEPADVAEADAGEAHRGTRAHERKSKLSAVDVMAMLAPLPAPVVPLAGGIASGGAPGTSAAASGTAGLGALAADGGAVARTASDAAAQAAAPAGDDARTGTGTGTAAEGDGAATRSAKDGPPAAPPTTTDARDVSDDTAGRLIAAAAADTAQAAPRGTRTPSAPHAATGAGAAAPATASVATHGDALPAVDADAVAAAGAVSATKALADAGEAARQTANDTPPDTHAGMAGATLALQGTAAPAERGGTAASATPVLSLAPTVGDDAWGPAIAQQLIRMNASGHQVAKLNLNPAELGPLKVTLTMSDNQTQALFVSAHDAVRKAVEAALPQLRTTLAAQGITLGQASVGAESQQSPGQGTAAFADPGPSRQRGQADYPAGRHGTPVAPAIAAPVVPARGRALSGLDTFA